MVAISIISLVSFLMLIQTSGVASAGYDVQHLEETRDHWRSLNYELEAEAARLQSLDRVDKDARAKLKMVPSGIPMFVSVGVEAPSTNPPIETRRTDPNAAPSVSVVQSDGFQGLLNWLAAIIDPAVGVETGGGR
jgi:hypothetical protein